MKKISRFSVLRVENNDLVREAPPRVDNYRNVLSVHGRVARPTLEELHVGHIPQTYVSHRKVLFYCFNNLNSNYIFDNKEFFLFVKGKTELLTYNKLKSDNLSVIRYLVHFSNHLSSR